MDGVRAIAIAYYDRATKGEKDLVKQYFKKLDTNGDGKITLQEFKNGVETYLSDENIFRKLDANGDGALGFEDIVCLYYMEKKLELHKCDKCRDLLVGAYFSCLRCVEDGLDSVCNLCCACYHMGDFSHDHALSNFLDHYTMAKVLKNHTPDARRHRGKQELEELRQIAKSYYLAGSQEAQDLAHEFFNSMDIDGDGRINLSEFLDFMKEEGYIRMQNTNFFKELDMDGNGTLDFDEVMTAYYIIKSGRPFCDECRDFIRGIYFSCFVCYRDPNDSFNLCRDCYRSKKCNHKHDDRAHFLDNFALFVAMKDLANQTPEDKNQAKTPVPSNSYDKSPVPSTSRAPLPLNSQAKSPVASHIPVSPVVANNIFYHTYVVNPPPPVTSYYNAVIHPPERKHWRLALKALEAAVAIGSIATAAAACTIM